MLALRAFIAGFLATLVFHQGLLGILFKAGVSPRPPFNKDAVPPLGVPQFVSLAFWGGVWAVAMAYAFMSLGGGSWLWWIVIGAIAPSAVALLVVFPMKGLPVDRKVLIGALLLNGAWGFGTALFLRYLPIGS